MASEEGLRDEQKTKALARTTYTWAAQLASRASSFECFRCIIITLIIRAVCDKHQNFFARFFFGHAHRSGIRRSPPIHQYVKCVRVESMLDSRDTHTHIEHRTFVSRMSSQCPIKIMHKIIRQLTARQPIYAHLWLFARLVRTLRCFVVHFELLIIISLSK